MHVTLIAGHHDLNGARPQLQCLGDAARLVKGIGNSSDHELAEFKSPVEFAQGIGPSKIKMEAVRLHPDIGTEFAITNGDGPTVRRPNSVEDRAALVNRGERVDRIKH